MRTALRATRPSLKSMSSPRRRWRRHSGDDSHRNMPVLEVLHLGPLQPLLPWKTQALKKQLFSLGWSTRTKYHPMFRLLDRLRSRP